MKHVNALITISVLALTSVGCQKSDDNKPAAAATPANEATTATEKEVLNTPQLTLNKTENGSYTVTAASQTLAVSLDNNPVKPTCKEISKLTHEISALETQQEQVLAVVAEDNSYEATVDALAQEINEKSEKLAALKASTYKVASKIKKAQFLADLETLQKDNADLKFEAVQPKSVKVSTTDAKGNATEQRLEASKVITRGSIQDLSKDDVTLSLDLNYDLLCSARETQQAAVQAKSKKPNIVVSFQ